MVDSSDNARRLLLVSGRDAVHFLQGILTQDVAKLGADGIQFAALLSPQGKILHDMFVIDSGKVGGLEPGAILLDMPSAHGELLRKRLAFYKLRAEVTFGPLDPAWTVQFSTEKGLADPRHPGLPRRLYGMAQAPGISADAYRTIELSLGIPDSARDFAPDEVVALDAGYDLLHAVSFTKGCYVGQEITARMHYKNIARRGFYILERDQTPVRLALLKFEEVEKSEGIVTLDGIAYRARLPEWMAPKLALSHQSTL